MSTEAHPLWLLDVSDLSTRFVAAGTNLHPLLVFVIVKKTSCFSNDNWELPAVSWPFAIALVFKVTKGDSALLPQCVAQEGCFGDGGWVNMR